MRRLGVFLNELQILADIERQEGKTIADADASLPIPWKLVERMLVDCYVGTDMSTVRLPHP